MYITGKIGKSYLCVVSSAVRHERVTICIHQRRRREKYDPALSKCRSNLFFQVGLNPRLILSSVSVAAWKKGFSFAYELKQLKQFERALISGGMVTLKYCSFERLVQLSIWPLSDDESLSMLKGCSFNTRCLKEAHV